jgi:hypothetical protein
MTNQRSGYGSKKVWLLVTLIAIAVSSYVYFGPKENVDVVGTAPSSTKGPLVEKSPSAGQLASLTSVTKAQQGTKSYVESSSFPPLPPPNTPLIEVIAELKSLSAKGNTLASCRLSAELNRCRTAVNSKALLLADEQRFNEMKTDDIDRSQLQKSITADRERIEIASRVCGGISSEDTKESWTYLLAAAYAGHVPSMTRLVVNPPLDEASFQNDIDRWQVYKQVAPQMIEEAVSKGDPAALYQLAAFTEGRLPGPGGPVVPKDLLRSYSLTLVLLQVSDVQSKVALQKRLARLASSLSSEQIVKAQSEATALVPKFNSKTNLSFRGGITLPEQFEDCAN